MSVEPSQFSGRTVCNDENAVREEIDTGDSGERVGAVAVDSSNLKLRN
jgi:hypothetical protein